MSRDRGGMAWYYAIKIAGKSAVIAAKAVVKGAAQAAKVVKK